VLVEEEDKTDLIYKLFDMTPTCRIHIMFILEADALEYVLSKKFLKKQLKKRNVELKSFIDDFDTGYKRLRRIIQGRDYGDVWEVKIRLMHIVR